LRGADIRQKMECRRAMEISQHRIGAFS
jgi:hypothetical protein